MASPVAAVLRRVARATLLAAATLYFLIDVVFLTMVRPLRQRIMRLRWVRRLRAWVESLNRYATLLLLLVPWLILEPVKPVGLVLFTRRHHLTATVVIAVGEIVKLILFEQLLDMTKPKLMTFAWFAWCYGKWRAAIERVRSLSVWHRLRQWRRSIQTWVAQRR
ncbi:MAG TPA: hypothetical protein VFL55_22525 [Acetobacteraceae bacterium]|nr:hypothetical protein [Acetobacteraceae bacterium]